MGDQVSAARYTRQALTAATHCGDEATMGKAYYELAREMFLSSSLQRSLEYSRHAVTLLERTGERWWLGMAHWLLAGIYTFLGAFPPALEAVAHARVIGEALGDHHIQSYAAFTACWIDATRGEYQAAMAHCQQSLVQSQDPVNTAHVRGTLGYAYLQQGQAAQARPLLEQAVQAWSQFRVRPMQAWMTTLLAEAHLLHGHLEQANDLAWQGLVMARDTKFQFAIGVAQRALGRIAQASGRLPEAATYLTEARQTFAAMQARFELGRTHLDLAALAQAQRNQPAAMAHLTAAHTLFRALQVPRYVERVVHCASAFGVNLPGG